MPLLTEPSNMPGESPSPVMHELEALRNAVHSLQESARRLESAHADASHPQTAKMFELLAKLRAVGAGEVLRAAEDDGFSIADEAATDIAGRIRRTITGLQSAVMGDQALLQSIIKSDRETHDLLQRALSEELPKATRSALESASEAVRAAVVQLEAQIA